MSFDYHIYLIQNLLAQSQYQQFIQKRYQFSGLFPNVFLDRKKELHYWLPDLFRNGSFKQSATQEKQDTMISEQVDKCELVFVHVVLQDF